VFFLLGLGSAVLLAGAFWIYQQQLQRHALAESHAAALAVPPPPAAGHGDDPR
jgi:hypothetical protein